MPKKETLDADLKSQRKSAEDLLSKELSVNRERLWRTVQTRLAPQLCGRIDPDDVLQEAFVDVVNRIDAFLTQDSYTPFVWLRLTIGQTLTNIHRRHLGAEKRSAYRESNAKLKFDSAATTRFLIDQIVGYNTSPSQTVMRHETIAKFEEIIEQMKPLDREILTLRHFEDMTNNEVAQLLGIESKAASIRYVRAIKRLKESLDVLGVEFEL